MHQPLPEKIFDHTGIAFPIYVLANSSVAPFKFLISYWMVVKNKYNDYAM
jgi:hypothetical protein